MEDRIIAACLDDEQHCIDTLKWELERHCPEIDLIFAANDPEDFTKQLKEQQIDLLFLDIHLKSTNGIDFLKSISPTDFKVIFVTAFDNYAVQAFELHAQNYLLKPIAGSKLKAAIQKVKENLNNGIDHLKLKEIATELKQEIRNIKKIPFAIQSGIEFIDPMQIMYVEGDSNYSKLHFQDETKLMVSKTLSHIENTLQEYSFLRIHKSYLINLSYIKRYNKVDGGYVELINGKQLSVSRSKRIILNELFKQ
jgi:two-component system LytT family response regulator